MKVFSNLDRGRVKKRKDADYRKSISLYGDMTRRFLSDVGRARGLVAAGNFLPDRSRVNMAAALPGVESTRRYSSNAFFQPALHLLFEYSLM